MIMKRRASPGTFVSVGVTKVAFLSCPLQPSPGPLSQNSGPGVGTVIRRGSTAGQEREGGSSTGTRSRGRPGPRRWTRGSPAELLGATDQDLTPRSGP